MNRADYLLVVAAEEAAEVAQAATKCLRFGPVQPYPEKGFTNATHLLLEFTQLWAVIQMLHDEGVLPHLILEQHRKLIDDKKASVEKYFKEHQELERPFS